MERLSLLLWARELPAVAMLLYELCGSVEEWLPVPKSHFPATLLCWVPADERGRDKSDL